MRTIVSGHLKPFQTTLPGRKPIQFGHIETVFPPRSFTVPPGDAVTLPDDDAERILEGHRRTGVLEVLPGQEVAEIVIEARLARAAYLQALLDDFRQKNSARRASQQDILMPQAIHRSWNRELGALKQMLKDVDAELLAETPFGAAAQAQRDESIAELAAFGITTDNAPLAPGLTTNEALGGGEQIGL